MVKPSPLLGRDAVLADISAALRDTRAGSGGCLVLTGPPGIGKSRLMEVGADTAAGLDIVVAQGRALELDRVAPLTTLFASLRTARPPIALLGAPEDRDLSPYGQIDRLGEALETYVAARPLLVAIDDAQWADELTVLALRILVPALASSPVRWMLARRSLPAASPAQETIDWLVQHHARELRLEPLDDDTVGQLCAHLLGAKADATVLEHATHARGNPFLVEQLLTTMNAAGQILITEQIATVVGSDAPSNYLAVEDQRLRGLPPATRALLEAGSIFGRPFTVHAAAALTAYRPMELLAATEEALATGLLVADDKRLTFAHDLLRQAVYHLISGPVRAAMHREAANVVRAEGCSAVEVADHYVRSGSTGDQEAIATLRRAAADMAARAPGTAADLILRALGMMGEHDRDRARVSAEAVSPLAAAGRLVEARELGEAALRGNLDKATEATLLLGLAEALKHAGHNALAVEYAQRALGRQAVPDRTRAKLYAIAAHSLLWSDDISSADRAGAEADRLGLATGEYAASVFGNTARSVVARAEGRLDDALAYAHQAVELADKEGGEAAQRHPRIWLGSALAALDRLEEANRVYTVGRREADRMGTAWSQPLWYFYYASALANAGKLDSAAAEAEAGLLLAGQLTASQLAVPLLGLLARIAVYRDQMPTARHRLRELQSLMDNGVTAAPEDLAWALASHREADGKADEALLALADVYDGLPERLLLLSNEHGCAPVMVRIALKVGERPRAEAAAGAARLLADRNPTVASLVGAAYHAEGLLADDLAALRAAVDHFAGSDRVLDRAHATEDCAMAEHRAGDRSRAVDLLEQAIGEYEACGADRATKRAEQQLRTLGVRRRARSRQPEPGAGIAGLTEAELPVARLVATGHTNRVVAERLFLSPHTVDSHLRSIFRKLSIRSRVELTRVMAEQEPRVPGI